MSKLQVIITSFSYKKGIPKDQSIHGGGFIFDCRCLPNPGRQAAFQRLTGQDEEVKKFLEEVPEIEKFYNHVSSLVKMAIASYLERGFEHLFIAFGCTGGQHRSVYMAARLAHELSTDDNLIIELNHRERML